MKKTNYLLLSLTLLLFLSCSTSNDGDAGGNDPQGTGDNNPVEIEKYLLEITGAEHDNIKLLYEDGKIVKGYIWGPLDAFQVEYNASGKVSKVIAQGHSFDGFDFDLTNCTDCRHFNYNYENGKISSIKFGTYNYLEYDYDGDRIIRTREYFLGENSIHRQYEYQYDTDNRITGIIFTEHGSGGAQSYFLNLTFDDKVNPFYILWKETGLHFPDDTSGIWRNNIVFYPNNVMKVEEGGEIDFFMTMNYDTDGYPVFFSIDGGDSGAIGYNE